MRRKHLLSSLLVWLAALLLVPTTAFAQLTWKRGSVASASAGHQTLNIKRAAGFPVKKGVRTALTHNKFTFNRVQTLSEAAGITIYGFTTNLNTDKSSIVVFNSEDPSDMTRVKELDEWPTAGAYANGAYYTMLTYAMMPKGLYTMDLETGEPTLVVDYMYNEDVRAAIEMSYDYTTQTMFMLTVSDEDSYSTAFGKVNLTTGEQTIINANMNAYFRTMAVDADGKVWAIDGDGRLCTIDKATGEATMEHQLMNEPFFRQSMEFDRNTGELYWAFCDSWDSGILYRVDVKEGRTQYLGYIGGSGMEQVVGLHIPYNPCAAGAPAEATNMSIAAGESGALTATITWTNPTKTFGGETLAALDSVVVYRNDAVAAKLTTATPGQAMSYDDQLDASGTYDYKVVCYNAEGKGMAASASAFIGRDVPQPVKITSVVREGTTGVKLTWNASKTGVNGGFLDMASVRYTIKRVSDDKVLAENISDTTFTDNTITLLARYRYEIEVSNADGVGGSTTTAYIVNGPVQTLPLSADFNDEEAAGLWSIGDANNDQAFWFWNFNYYEEKGYFYYQAETLVDADDWLISPLYHFEAGKNYKMVVDAKPSSPYSPEKMQFYLVKNYDLSTATAISDVIDVIGEENEDYEVILKQYRANFSDVEAGDYSVAVRCISSIDDGYWLAVAKVEVSENHDGNIRGSVWDNTDTPVAGAKVSVVGTTFEALTDANGDFEISNVPQGDYELLVSKLGYKDAESAVTVSELKTVNVELDIEKRKEMALTVHVTNEYGESLPGVGVQITGYNAYAATTDKEGVATFANVYDDAEPYTIVAAKSFYESDTTTVQLSEATSAIKMVLNDAIIAPATVSATVAEDDRSAEVAWSAPGVAANVENFTRETSAAFGTSEGDKNTLIGVVCHEPVLLNEISWLTYHDYETMNVVILALDADGNVTSEELYRDEAAENWPYETTPYKLKNSVYAPHGCFIGLSINEGNLSLATATNTDEKPFLYQTNAYIEDLATKAQLEYVEALGEEYQENFRISYSGYLLADGEAPEVSYNVYCVNAAGSDVHTAKSEVLNYVDQAWAQLAAGDGYYYAVEAVYRNGKVSERTTSGTLSKTVIEAIESATADKAISVSGSTVRFAETANSVKVLTSAGQVVMQQNGASSLSLEGWNAGVYVIVANVGGKQITQKLIVK